MTQQSNKPYLLSKHEPWPNSKSNLVDILLAKTKTLENNVLFPLLVLYFGIRKDPNSLYVYMGCETQFRIVDQESQWGCLKYHKPIT